MRNCVTILEMKVIFAYKQKAEHLSKYRNRTIKRTTNANYKTNGENHPSMSENKGDSSYQPHVEGRFAECELIETVVSAITCLTSSSRGISPPLLITAIT